MIDTLRLTAEEASGLVERGEVSGAELHRAYLDAIAERDPGAARLPLHGRGARGRRRADRAQGRDLDARRRDDRRLEDPRGLQAGLRRDRRRPLQGRGPAAARQDEPRRVRDGLLDRELRLRPDPQPVGSEPRARAARRAARPRPSRPGSRRGRSAPTPAARSSSRPSLCGVVGLRPTYGTVSRYGIVAFASSLDQVGPIAKTVRDCALLHRIVAGRDPLDSTTVELPEPIELPRGRGPEGPARRRPQGAERGRGHRARRQRGRQPHDRARPRARVPRWGSAACRARSSSACRATT